MAAKQESAKKETNVNAKPDKPAEKPAARATADAAKPAPRQSVAEKPAERRGPTAHVGAHAPVGVESVNQADGDIELKPDHNPVIDVQEVESDNPNVVEAVGLETAPSVGEFDRSNPDLMVEDLADGTRITRNAHGDVVVEQPGVGPYRDPELQR